MLKKLEDLIKFFPLIVILLTTLGYINLFCYYSYFDIEILNYLDLFEIILLFFDKSILLISVILIVIAISYIIDNQITQEITKEIPAETAEEIANKIAKTKSDLLKGQKRAKITAIIFVIVLILYTVDILLEEKYINLIYSVSYTICLVIYYLLEKYFIDKLFLKSTTVFFFSIYIGLAAFLGITLWSITSSIEKGYDLRYNQQIIKQVSFSYNNIIIDI